MFFLGSALRTGACTNEARKMVFSTSLNLMSAWLQAIQSLNLKVRKIGRRKREEDSGHGRERELVLQENNNLCDGEVFFLDRNLLMGS